MKKIFAHRQVDVLGHKFAISLPMQFAAFAAILFVVIYAVGMTTYPPIHDSFHALRHSFGIFPCH